MFCVVLIVLHNQKILKLTLDLQNFFHYKYNIFICRTVSYIKSINFWYKFGMAQLQPMEVKKKEYLTNNRLVISYNYG